MDKKAFLESITQIGTLEDIADVRTKLTELSDAVGGVFDDNESLTTANKQFEEDNEKLRAANMKLFLKVGEQKSPEEIQKGATGLTPEEPEKKRSFDDLLKQF